jgi:hypothetical protein
MRKQIKTCAACALTVFSCVTLSAQKIIDGFAAPESVIKISDKLYVSNVNGNPGDKDGNGYISQLSADGKLLQQKFQKATLNAPKGLAVINNTLYVTDIDRIVGFNSSSGEQVFELNIEGAGFLNDLCKAGDNKLAASESMSGKIFIVDAGNKTYSVAGSIGGANGVTYDAKTKMLYACGMGEQMNGTGKLYVKDINSKDTVFTELPGSPTGIFDGLEMTDEGHLLVSDWISFNSNKARLIEYDLKNHTSTVFSVDAGAADFCYDRAGKKIYIPHLTKNNIEITSLGNLKKE